VVTGWTRGRDAVTDDLPKAEAVIEAAAKALPHLPVFTI
jgi:hypothetical protein